MRNTQKILLDLLITYTNAVTPQVYRRIDQLRQNTRLYDLGMGTAEPAAENYFKANIP
jgi:hypothetical protein